jgi:phosphate:Na+ symporter
MNELYSSLAGLGLFLAGLQLLSSSMLPFAGKRLRILLSKLTSSYFSSAIAGSFLGAVTQSTSGATFVCMGMLKSGVMDFKSILVLLAWSGVGTSILVFLVSVNISLAGFYLVSIVGIAYLIKLERLKYTKHLVAIAFALGLLFLGLGMLKEASHLLNQSEWVKSFVLFSSNYLVLSLIAGLLLSVLTQSSSTVTVIAITLCASGVIGFRNAVIFVFGANIGSGLSLLLISMHLKGMPKQLAAFQCFVKVAGVAIILPIFLIVEPIIHSTSSNQLNSAELATQVSIIFLLLQIVGAICAAAFRNRLATLLESCFPNPVEDSLSKPQFIYPEAVDDSEIALLLLKKEQARFIKSFIHYLEHFSKDTISNSDLLLQNKNVFQANKQLADHIQLFTETLAKNNTNESAITLIFKAQSLNQSLFGLNETLYTFSNTLLGEQNLFKNVGLHASLLESVHLILMLFVDATQDEDDKSTLIEITSDKSKMMEKIRNQLINDLSIDMQVRQSLIFSTGVFERLIWQVQQAALLF